MATGRGDSGMTNPRNLACRLVCLSEWSEPVFLGPRLRGDDEETAAIVSLPTVP
jgi:hypothetical protein